MRFDLKFTLVAVVLVLSVLYSGYLFGQHRAWLKANEEITALEDHVTFLEDRITTLEKQLAEKKGGRKVKSVFRKGWDLTRKGTKKGWDLTKKGTKKGYGYTKKGAGVTKDFSVGLGKTIAGLSGKAYNGTTDYMDTDFTRRIMAAASLEELKDLAEEAREVLDSDAVRKSVRVLEDTTMKCVNSETCKALGKQALVAGGGSVIGSGLIAATGMTAAGMVGGGAGVGAAAGPVGAVAGATVGLAVYGIVKAFETKEKELAPDGDGDYMTE